MLVEVLAALDFAAPATSAARPAAAGADRRLLQNPQPLYSPNTTLSAVEVITPGARIIGGQEGDIRNFPWMASVRCEVGHPVLWRMICACATAAAIAVLT